MPDPAPSRVTRGPFRAVRPDVVVGVCFGLAALAWSLVDALPGPRWVAVHLFTLGALTPLIVGFSREQVRTLLRVAPRWDRSVRLLLVAGAGAVAAGMATPGAPWAPAAIGLGGLSSAGGVLLALVELRRARRVTDRAGRFDWLVRAYVHAHLLFLVGAALGAVLGAGLVPGRAYGAVRFGHLHVLPVGFAALTLVATVVLYGPMLLRAQIAPAAEATARRWLPRAAAGAALATLGMLGRALPAPWTAAGGAVAGAGILLVAATAALALRQQVAIVVRKGRASPLVGVLLTAGLAWLTLALFADAVVVTTGAWRYLDAVGGVALVGGFAQAILAVLLHVGTMYLPRDRRIRLYPRLDALPLWVVVPPQVVVLALAVGWLR